MSPEKIFVLACVDFSSIEMSQRIADAMLSAAHAKDQLEFTHQEAMNRFDAVRREYLREQGVDLAPGGAGLPSP